MDLRMWLIFYNHLNRYKADYKREIYNACFLCLSYYHEMAVVSF